LQIAAIGYCFGGMCVLDMARANLDVKLVVSLHGALTNVKDAIDPKQESAIRASVQVLHGYDDPHIPIDQVRKIENCINKMMIMP
jgi:dienelactone hydrolase